MWILENHPTMGVGTSMKSGYGRRMDSIALALVASRNGGLFWQRERGRTRVTPSFPPIERVWDGSMEGRLAGEPFPRRVKRIVLLLCLLMTGRALAEPALAR